MDKNITIKIDEQIILKSREKAIQSGKSLSKVVKEFLIQYCHIDSTKAHVRKVALNRLKKGYALGGTPIKRDSIYAR